jgi:hypothetical protein
VSIVCLIATWCDGPLLVEAVESATPHVDAVVVLDGVYAGLDEALILEHYQDRAVAPGGSAASSPFGDLLAAAHRGAYIAPAPWWAWPGEIEKRNVLLELGRTLVPPIEGDPFGRFALVLDADERLIVPDGWDFREWVDLLRPFGLPRIEPDGAVWSAPSRLFPLRDFTRYQGKSYTLRDGPSGFVTLEHRRFDEATLGGPHVEHRWNLREPWRLEVQRAWGRRLAALDAE